MQVMLDAVMPSLAKGRPILTRAARIDAPEGDVALPLAALQVAHPQVQIGSYPFFEQKQLGTYVVLRAADAEGLQSAYDSLWTIIVENGFAALRSEDE
jgi:molybdopterin-biosynthesis enzyme MoeA-like protein